MERKTREPQYNLQFERLEKDGPVMMGPTASHLWRNDPKHLSFLLARYKFCSKILYGRRKVLEVGCGDSFALPLILQAVKSVHGIDFDPLFINWAKNQHKKENNRCSFATVDITRKFPLGGPYDAVYALDFIEHIQKKQENKVMRNICRVLNDEAVCILGTPNLYSAKFASRDSKKGHINLKNEATLRKLLAIYFKNIFIFSMNDEVVHTGFYPMAHYLLGVGVGLKVRER
jgi:2-polyprenyl-3-methyl-5-hydroxy-6-metoxy-1,4-benzoquinol methylase